MKAMADGRAPDVTVRRGTTQDERPAEEVRWAFDRTSLDRVVAYGVDPANPSAPVEADFGLVFDRSGFASWRLTEVRLPTGR